MLNALITIVNLMVTLITKASADPDVQALAKALHDLVAAHNSTPTPPPAA